VAIICPIRASREALSAFLARASSVTVEYGAGTSPEELAGLRHVPVDVVLLDGCIREGLEAIMTVRGLLPDAPLIVYGVSATPETLLACARRGATLVASQDAGTAALVELVRGAAARRLEGQAAVNAALLESLAAVTRGAVWAPSLALTRREREIALSLADGLSNKQIAQRYSISLATVKSHVHHVLRKVGADRREHVVYRLRDLASGVDPNSAMITTLR
jgi:two-component system, NarL family, nitrate/nitrite response regulator NarL